MKILIVPEHEAGERIDAWLAQQFPEQSRSHFQKLIKSGGILLNGRAAKANAVLGSGDAIEFAPAKASEPVPSEAPAPTFIDETADFFVIEKPAGLLVHPAPGQRATTLVDFLLKRDPKIAAVGDAAERPGIVHRLDKEASGLMVVARTEKAFAHFKAQFQKHDVTKEYLALAYGKVAKDADTIEAAIGRKKGRGRMSARAKPLEGDKEARSSYDVLERFPHASLVRVRTETGRMHQVRVHMKSIGHPLVGDELYAPQKLRSSPSLRGTRLFLHAAVLGFRDPSGEWREYRSELSPDLASLLETLRKKHGKA